MYCHQCSATIVLPAMYCPRRYRTLAEEFGTLEHALGSGSLSGLSCGSMASSSSTRGSQLGTALSEEGSAANANLYVLLRACDRWVQLGGRSVARG